MGSALVLIALRVAYAFGATARIAALVDSCEHAWTSVLESDSTAALQLIEELVNALEKEADMQRELVREREQEHTSSTVLGVMRQFWTYLGFDSNYSELYQQKRPRHLLILSDHILGNQGTPRAMYHRSAAWTLPPLRVQAVECLDQLYFQVPPFLQRTSKSSTHQPYQVSLVPVTRLCTQPRDNDLAEHLL